MNNRFDFFFIDALNWSGKRYSAVVLSYLCLMGSFYWADRVSYFSAFFGLLAIPLLFQKKRSGFFWGSVATGLYTHPLFVNEQYISAITLFIGSVYLAARGFSWPRGAAAIRRSPTIAERLECLALFFAFWWAFYTNSSFTGTPNPVTDSLFFSSVIATGVFWWLGSKLKWVFLSTAAIAFSLLWSTIAFGIPAVINGGVLVLYSLNQLWKEYKESKDG